MRDFNNLSFSSVQSLSRVWLFVTPWATARQAFLSTGKSQSLLKLMSIELVMPSNHLFLCRPLLLLPSIFPSVRVFSNESALPIKWPKYWSFRVPPDWATELTDSQNLPQDWTLSWLASGGPRGLSPTAGVSPLVPFLPVAPRIPSTRCQLAKPAEAPQCLHRPTPSSASLLNVWIFIKSS